MLQQQQPRVAIYSHLNDNEVFLSIKSINLRATIGTGIIFHIYIFNLEHECFSDCRALWRLPKLLLPTLLFHFGAAL